MKFRSVLLSSVFTVCILSSCGAANNMRTNVDFSVPDTVQTTESAAVPTPDSAVTAETAGIAGTLHMLGDANTQGWYKIQYGDAPGWYASEYVFADAAEKRLEVPAGMPNGIPESVRPGDLLVDDTQLVWTWSGLLTDTPALVVTDLDGSQTGAVHFPQGWYLTGWQPIAADAQYLYAKGGAISDDPGRPDERRLLRLDPQNDTIETLTTWDAYGGQLWGTWGDELLITRRVLSPACPVQPEYAFYRIDNFNDMKPFLTEMLYALDPATGRETLLAEGPVYTFGPRQKLAGDALWWVDGTQLLRQPLGTDAPQTVADLPQTMWVEQVFDTDVFLCAQQGDKTVRYVYHLADGTLEETPAEVLCQLGVGEYLIKAGDGVAVMG